MKKMKRMAAAVAALAMTAALALPMTASLTTTAATITVSNASVGDQYAAYKLLVASVGEGGAITYTINTKYEAAIKEAIKSVDSSFDTETDDPIDWLSKRNAVAADGDVSEDEAEQQTNTNAAQMRQFADAVYVEIAKAGTVFDAEIEVTSEADSNKFTDLPDGYYLVVQTGKTTDGTYSVALIDTAKDAGMTTKTAAPSFDKKIKDTDDSGTESAPLKGNDTGMDDWRESADHDAGDLVEFQLTATLPSDLLSYKESGYTLIFHDALDDTVFGTPGNFSLVFAGATYVLHTDGKWYKSDDTGHETAIESIIYRAAECDNDDLGHDGSACEFEIIITDIFALNANVATTDTITVYYSAELTEEANIGPDGNWNAGKLEYSNNPYWNAKGDKDWDDDENTTDETEEETVVTFTYEVDVDKVNPDKDNLKGAKFSLWKYYLNENIPAGTADEDKKVDSGDEVGTWVKVETIDHSDEGTYNQFNFKCIDAGLYKIVEDAPPAGYVKGEDVVFEVRATHTQTDTGKELTELEVYDKAGNLLSDETENAKFTATKENGKIGTMIVNTTGSQLPSTGGIGTTLFYVIGGTLVAGAGVTLITKKRMKKEEE